MVTRPFWHLSRRGRCGTAVFVLLSFAAVPASGQQKNDSDPVRLGTGVEGDRGSAPPQSRRPRNRKKPRLSNVGYIDSAVIGTQLQFRFDSLLAAGENSHLWRTKRLQLGVREPDVEGRLPMTE